MTSEPAYRQGASARVEPLTVRYVAFTWSAPVAPLLILAAAGWATNGEQGPLRLQRLAVATTMALFVAFTQFPVITIRARKQDGKLTITGTRWPGAVQTWVLSLDEARRFTTGVMEDPKQGPYRYLALLTTDGRALPLTTSTFRAGAWLHTRPVARLNAWLDAARDVTGT